MIIVANGPDFLCITQPDHAHFSGELLALWRAGGVPDHPRREELIFAAREHDNGWREADAAPRWNAALGLPFDFVSIPREDRIAIWERGTARFAGPRPYAALLITRHALNLHRDRRGQEGWDEFLGSLDELERSLFEVTGASAGEVAADYRLIDLADLVSLAACNRWREPFERHGMRGWFEDGTLYLDPLPLAGATTFLIPYRRIPHRPYAGDVELSVELATARWQELRLRVAGR